MNWLKVHWQAFQSGVRQLWGPEKEQAWEGTWCCRCGKALTGNPFGKSHG